MPYIAIAQLVLQVLEQIITALNHGSVTPVMQQVLPTLMDAQNKVRMALAEIAKMPPQEDRIAALEKAVADRR